jgi:hypothetical protein
VRGICRSIRLCSLAELSLQHDAWVIIDGEVWDVTQFLKHHVSFFECLGLRHMLIEIVQPGGAKIILSNAGRDVT